MQYWLIKSEPDAFSIEDLKKLPGKKDHWDGIRNYQARNMMRDDMKKDDLAFFYHSSCAIPGIVGIVRVSKEAYPDHTALNPKSQYYDAKSTKDNQRWCMVDVTFEKQFGNMVTLRNIKENSKLKDMLLVKKGNRLSIMPVNERHWNEIISMAA